MNKDWNRIYESPKYMKRFLKDYKTIYERSYGTVGNTEDNNANYYYSDGQPNNCNNDNNDFDLFIFDFESILLEVRSDLTKKEWRDLCLWICGYTELDIASYYNTQREGIHNRLISVSKKIIKRWNEKNGTEKFVS